MSRLTLFLGLAALATARHCQNITIPISISSRNGIFDLRAPTSNIEVTNYVMDFIQPGHNYTADLLQGYATVSGNYEIVATYCEPKFGPSKRNTLQVLTHGVGFDRSYWDFPAKNYNYSYVNAALDRGYSTLAFDRLGIGQSSHGEPVDEIQSFLEVSALYALTGKLRAGTVPHIAARFDKIVHVGHSFGSIQTYGLTAAYEGVSDGIALTGFSSAAGFIPNFLLGANFVLANGHPALANYADGYLAPGDDSGVHADFFAPGDFDPEILEAAYSTAQPVTVGELLTIAGPASAPSSFEGPVLVITGDRDLPFCGGNCSTSNPSIPAMVEQLFTNTSHFEAVVVPGSGHGLNLEYTWPITYKAILDFFDTQVQ